MHKQKHTGFTIVELLIVIVVIGILAAITIVAYNGIQQRARLATAQSDMRNIGQRINLKVVDGVALNNAVLADVLKEANLYDATRVRTNKTFSLCFNASDNSRFAVVAFDPVSSSSSVPDGTRLQAWSSISGMEEVTYSVASETYVGGRACRAVLPTTTSSQAWSYNL